MFQENLSGECPVAPCIKTGKRTEGHVHIMKLIVAFRNCVANASENRKTQGAFPAFR